MVGCIRRLGMSVPFRSLYKYQAKAMLCLVNYILPSLWWALLFTRCMNFVFEKISSDVRTIQDNLKSLSGVK